MNNPSPCFRIRTSLTSAGKRNSCGSRTAWFAPLRNMDARLATELDVDLASAHRNSPISWIVHSSAHIVATDYASHIAGSLTKFNSSRFGLLEEARDVDLGTRTPHRGARELFERKPPRIERFGWRRRGYYHSI